MRNSREYATVLNKLIRKLRRSKGAQEDHELTDPVTEIILACLTLHTTEAKGVTALNKLGSHFVDFNELRVCRESEVVRILGNTFPHARDTAGMILQCLKEIFDQRDTLKLDFLQSAGKREAKAFLEGMKVLPTYVQSRVMLRSLDGHAFPLHEKLVTALQAEGAVDPKATEADVQGFLERQIASKDIHKTYELLRSFADTYRSRKTPTKKKASEDTPKPKAKTARKSTKKKKKKTTKSRKA
jgi:hypothetical protein